MARVVGHIVEAEHIQTFTGRLTYHLMLEVSVEEFEHYPVGQEVQLIPTGGRLYSASAVEESNDR